MTLTAIHPKLPMRNKTITPMLTPEKAPRLRARIKLDISTNLAHCLDCLGTWHVSGQQDIEVLEVGLSKTLVQVLDLLRRCLRALYLFIRGVVAFSS